VLKPIGVFALTRSRARPFTSRQLDLVTTFADQALRSTRSAAAGRSILEIMQSSLLLGYQGPSEQDDP
jgi:GAF domain-containing protein